MKLIRYIFDRIFFASYNLVLGRREANGPILIFNAMGRTKGAGDSQGLKKS